MIVRGRYVARGGIYRPFVVLRVRSASGSWVPIPFLIDTGADATFLNHACVAHLDLDVSPLPLKSDASGVSGGFLYYETHIWLRLEAETGEARVFAGNLGVMADPVTSDVPVLGRDVLNQFAAIFDYKRNEILLIAEPDDYRVGRR
jgi:hypothetical protein